MFGLKLLQPFFRKLYFFSLRGMNYNMVGSGEEFSLKYIFSKRKKYNIVVFDIGANVGQYAKLLLPHLTSEDKVYSFEPSIDTFRKLDENVKDGRVKKENIGLGDKIEKVKLYREEKESTVASLFQREIIGGESADYEDVSIDTIDHFCVENNIREVFFLKVDVEGFDLAVLKGAKKLIERKAIEYIQFEFGGTQILPRIFLKDFWNLLHEDFRIYRILKNGILEIEEYSEWIEIFAYANYLAIKR